MESVRISFQEELEQVEAALQEEGDYVLRALRAAVNAVEQADSELADEVVAFDDEIDERYFGIEEGIQSLLARQTPVAVDLRLVLAMLHANLHLERMGDYCVTIAKLTKLVADVEPDVVLLDEPASALDPIATSKIEDLMHELKNEYTLVIVTHNMQQAARVADRTAFFTLDVEDGRPAGVLVEYDETPKIFTQPSDKRTEGYVTGRFG